jgi:Zn-dependent protease with chaperone function
MDFFKGQDRARRRTKWLVLYFGLAVLGIIGVLYLVFATLLYWQASSAPGKSPVIWDPMLFLGVAGGTCLVVLGGSLYQLAALRRGGPAVAEMLGGQRIAPNTRDPDERRVLNVVEEMALASGTAVPPVYLLGEEQGINAFAAGHHTGDAAIGVTRGCITRLNRDELQGVIAHEFSHILNGDMRLNLRLMGVIFGILCLAVIGRVLLFSGRAHYRLGARSQGKGGNPLPLIGLALIIVGSIGVLFGRLIQAAVSRQREFLADAAAVQFTRNPAGIAGALKKIAGYAHGTRLGSAHASEAGHLFFGNALKASFLGLLATHPPIEERIRAIDPSFTSQTGRKSPPASDGSRPLTAPSPDLRSQHVAPPPLSGFASAPTAAAESLRTLGTPEPLHLEAAIAWRDALSPELDRAVHDPWDARFLIFALLLSRDPGVEARQVEMLEVACGPDTRAATVEAQKLLSALGTAGRLPLVELCTSALRELSPDQYSTFRRQIRALIEADRQVDLFEFALEKCLERHLTPHFEPPRTQPVRYHAVGPLLAEVAAGLAVLAQAGATNPQAGKAAYAAALNALAVATDPLSGRAWQGLGLADLDRALRMLAEASLPVRRQFLQAAATAVAHDGQLQIPEAELLRAMADALDCPIPPFLTSRPPRASPSTTAPARPQTPRQSVAPESGAPGA